MIQKFNDFKINEENILTEIKNMSDEDVELMLNENKKIFESIYYDLQYLKNGVQKLNDRVDKVNDILIRNNLK